MGKTRYKTFYIPEYMEQTYQEFNRQAKEEYGSVSEALRRFIQRYVEKRNKGRQAKSLKQFIEEE